MSERALSVFSPFCIHVSKVTDDKHDCFPPWDVHKITQMADICPAIC